MNPKSYKTHKINIFLTPGKPGQWGPVTELNPGVDILVTISCFNLLYVYASWSDFEIKWYYHKIMRKNPKSPARKAWRDPEGAIGPLAASCRWPLEAKDGTHDYIHRASKPPLICWHCGWYRIKLSWVPPGGIWLYGLFAAPYEAILWQIDEVYLNRQRPGIRVLLFLLQRWTISQVVCLELLKQDILGLSNVFNNI